jgi:hypothetical protein
MPDDYISLIREATEFELETSDGVYLRIWAPFDCLDVETGHSISKYLPGAIPIGDDGGDDIFFYWNGARDHGTSIDQCGRLSGRGF